jgi:hypothetical protein
MKPWRENGSSDTFTPRFWWRAMSRSSGRTMITVVGLAMSGGSTRGSAGPRVMVRRTHVSCFCNPFLCSSSVITFGQFRSGIGRPRMSADVRSRWKCSSIAKARPL